MSSTRNDRNKHRQQIDNTQEMEEEQVVEKKRKRIRKASEETQTSVSESQPEQTKPKKRKTIREETPPLSLDEIEDEANPVEANQEDDQPEEIESIDTTNSPFMTSSSSSHIVSPKPMYPSVEAREFDASDMAHLSTNEYMRYLIDKPGRKIGYALLKRDDKKQESAYQFAIPQGDEQNLPQLRPLHQFKVIQRYGQSRLEAATPDGTRMYGKRQVFLEAGEKGREAEAEAMRLVMFSPSGVPGKEPFWGGAHKPTALFSGKLNKEAKKELAQELKEIEKTVRGGFEMVVDHESVRIRDGIKTRNPDQNTVMGESAKDAYERFLEKYMDVLHPDMKARLKRAIDAPLRDAFYSNYRPEWLHIYGHGLYPMAYQLCLMTDDTELQPNKFYVRVVKGVLAYSVITPSGEQVKDVRTKVKAPNQPFTELMLETYQEELLKIAFKAGNVIEMEPQRADNLAAAPKWANTEMMVLERILKWFALNRPESVLKLKSFFEMLLDSELVKEINFQVTVEEKERFVKFLQTIDPFDPYPLFRHASDMMFSTATAYNLLDNAEPVSVQQIQRASAGAGGVNAASFASSSSSAAASVSSSSSPRKQAVSSQSSSSSRAMELPSQEVESVTKRHERSIVQIFTTSVHPNYDDPTKGADESECRGSGFVIRHNKKFYIVTNAHCVENGVWMCVRLANHNEKFEAERVYTSYQSDLALLEVKDPDFQKLAKPAEIGEMVRTEQKVYTIGFPKGGLEVSTDVGIVGRIEVESYEESGAYMLQVQVGAAINSGNSGGPVFSDHKVVGVAFQGYGGCQGLNYMIPVPIINHFLQEAVSGKPKGFPEIPLFVEPLENAELRNYHGMSKTQTGLRVMKVDRGTDAHAKLKPDDILLEIDGHQISNEGTVDIEGIGQRITWSHIGHMKFKGDSVTFKVLRDGGERDFYWANLPKNTSTYKNSYVFTNNQLYYIDRDGEVDRVVIDDKSKFLEALKKLNPEKRNKMRLSKEQIESTITANGGHTPVCNPEVQVVDVTLDKIPHETEVVIAKEYDKMPTFYIASGIQFQPVTQNYIEGRGADLEEVFFADQGCSLTAMDKGDPNEQMVVISNVLGCKQNMSYDARINDKVKSINGKTIKHIRDVVNAIENNKGPKHKIVTASGYRLIVNNMSQDEHAKLLKKYRKTAYCSEDLLPEAAQSHEANDNMEPECPSASSSSSASSSASAARATKFSKPSRSSMSPELSEAEESEHEDDDELTPEQRELTIADLPGARRFRAFVDELEEKYKDEKIDDEDYVDLNELPDDDDENDEDYQDKMVESEVEESAAEADDEPEVASSNKKASTLARLPMRHRFFSSSSNKRPREEEQEQQRKRHGFGS
jgi:S1-C subfamily serine protease